MKRLGLLALVAPALARAQPPAQITDVEVPAVVIETSDEQGPAGDDTLDLANIVQSAAKGITTVQEAPAIVTVITDDEIRERQFQELSQLYDTVPGWNRTGLLHSNFVQPLVRGQAQAVQFLHDGVSLFDPFVNVASSTRVQPMELVKRVELITGPGGVLWGSNSLLGIMNVITKDAQDLEGIEIGASVGHGRGDRFMSRAYAMAGKTGFFDGKLSLFGHGSVETYQGPGFRMPLLDYHGALPQPNSANIYGPLVTTDQPQSLIANFHGKATLGDVHLRFALPFGEKYNPHGFSGQPVREDLGEDERCPVGSDDATCTDPDRKSRANRFDQYDRYAVVEYRTRFAEETAGITARAYAIQFVRSIAPLQVLASSTALQGGLSIAADLTSYRAGGAVDGDIEITRKGRVLYGAEAFREWKPDDVTRSRQGAGTESTLPAPADLTRIPVLCPRTYDADRMQLVPLDGCPLTFAFPAERTVLGAYVNPQYRPSKQLIFDLGGRVQVAPESMGTLSYPLSTTIAGAAVWNFLPGWHLKLNYTQGFRPPVFNNTTANGAAVQIGGNPELAVETSDAAQAEINARIWKGERRIRELSFRIDGSYTRIENLIQVQAGNYDNTGERGIASVEFLGKLYVQGGHRVELGYTYLRVDTSDKGRLRAMPEHWFDIATVFALSEKLGATARLEVTGAAEDVNRLVEYRGLVLDGSGEPTGTVAVAATDLVLDRIPPIAELSLGIAYMPTKQLALRATAYNALVGASFQPDAFFDYEPHLEYLPNPYEGFRAYLSAYYQY